MEEELISAEEFFGGLDKQERTPLVRISDKKVGGKGQVTFDDTKVNSLLSKCELVVGGHNDKLTGLIEGTDLTQGIDSLDTRHLDVHDYDVRHKGLGNLNALTAGLGCLYLTGFSEIFGDDKLQGIQNDSLIIC